jgi:hypothetical protein
MLIDAFCSLGAETVPSIYCHRGPAGECVVMVAIDAKLLQLDAETPSVELHWNGISVHVSTTNGFITASQHGTGKWCWIAATIPAGAVPGRCGILLSRKGSVLAKGEIKLHDHVPLRNVRRSGSLLNGLFGEYFLRTTRPVLNIHFWHEDVAREIAALPGAAERYFEIRLLTPANIDPQSVEQFIGQLRADHQFRKISRLMVPARGRDIGGLVGLLQADAGNQALAGRPQLFTHTKKTSYLPPLAQADWRRGLLSSLAAGRNLRCALRQLFFPKTAMVCAGERACVEPFPEMAGPRKGSFDLAESLAQGLFSRKPAEYVFSAGTMFWLRVDRTSKAWTPERLQRITSRLEPSEDLTEPSHAHAFERLFPAAVADSGFRVALV